MGWCDMKNKIILVISILILFNPDFVLSETTIDRLVKKIIRPSYSNDKKMYELEKWVIKNITYNSDEKQFNMTERWTLPMETLQRKSGDCEDGSILLMALAVTAGVPGERLRLYAPIKVPTGWHACVAYQRESDNEWVWMEWAFKRSSGFGPVDRRKTLEQYYAYLPLGTYLKVTSLNPFDMIFIED